ncbi:hypothetical protein MesoLjLb_49970 [Mesorhizobium sp. L-8-3]|nr:hypothetical protein MesoLjLb_49970 [Mesorhizobium sp. L-8-3]
MAAFLDGYARPGPAASLLCDHSSGSFRKVPGERHADIVLNMQERAKAMPISDESFVDATMQNPANVVIM